MDFISGVSGSPFSSNFDVEYLLLDFGHKAEELGKLDGNTTQSTRIHISFCLHIAVVSLAGNINIFKATICLRDETIVSQILATSIHDISHGVLHCFIGFLHNILGKGAWDQQIILFSGFGDC
mmetsp:Transcript_13124/g.21042  ORF Transcript_13124/g.21042 Transcript_13124/m.21042 type:complete len:123 (+) Transcript_13124:275-643(+)